MCLALFSFTTTYTYIRHFYISYNYNTTMINEDTNMNDAHMPTIGAGRGGAGNRGGRGGGRHHGRNVWQKIPFYVFYISMLMMGLAPPVWFLPPMGP